MNGVTDHLRPEERNQLDTHEFARIATLTPDEVRELVDYGLLPPGRFDTHTALALREAARLRRDFDLDLFATGLLAGYVREISELQATVRQLKAERSGRVVYSEVQFTAVTRTVR